MSIWRRTYRESVPHGITFIAADGTEKHTWNDWRIVPTSRPVIQMPPVRKKGVEIPGMNGQLDFTEAQTGTVLYDNRVGTLEFISQNRDMSWAQLFSVLADFLHGKRVRAILDDDPWWYYEGRFSLNEWRSDEQVSFIALDYDLGPFKIERFSSIEDWLWDPFDFVNGVIRNYNDLWVDDMVGLYLNIIGLDMPVCPKFNVTTMDESGMRLTYRGTTWNLPEAASSDDWCEIPELILGPGENLLHFSVPPNMNGGNVSVLYRGGRL